MLVYSKITRDGIHIRLSSSTYAAILLLVAACLTVTTRAAGQSKPEETETEAFANQLIDAPVQSARETLLKAHPALQTDALTSALTARGEHHRSQGEFSKAATAFELAKTIATHDNQPSKVADALRNLGINARLQQQYPEAEKYFREALGLAEQIGDTRMMARAEGNMAAVFAQSGDYDKSVAAFNHSLQLAESIQDTDLIGRSLANLGLVAQNRGDLAAARDYIGRALKLEEAEKFPARDIATLYLNLGVIAANEGGQRPSALQLSPQPSGPGK
jgi:tetratricopeptide (TPR) repeat protein